MKKYLLFLLIATSLSVVTNASDNLSEENKENNPKKRKFDEINSNEKNEQIRNKKKKVEENIEEVASQDNNQDNTNKHLNVVSEEHINLAIRLIRLNPVVTFEQITAASAFIPQKLPSSQTTNSLQITSQDDENVENESNNNQNGSNIN
jgi:hypothetical protein